MQVVSKVAGKQTGRIFGCERRGGEGGEFRERKSLLDLKAGSRTENASLRGDWREFNANKKASRGGGGVVRRGGSKSQAKEVGGKENMQFGDKLFGGWATTVKVVGVEPRRFYNGNLWRGGPTRRIPERKL